MNTLPKLQFIDLAAQQRRLRGELDAAIDAVLDQGAYIMGPEVKAFEREVADFCGAKHAIGCANGTDALQLALMALGIGKGDAIFVPSFTFAATAEIAPFVGAVPVFVDSLDGTFNMSPDSLERAIAHVRTLGLRPRAIIPVDLFGLPADMAAIDAIAARENLSVICDSAQGFGGSIDGRSTGTFGHVTTTSFFPAKPLGCYGDGGALFTDDSELAAVIDSLRVHGKGSDKYDNVRIGMNSRLDTLQAAILRVKLSVYREEIDARNAIAARYSEHLGNVVTVPHVPAGYRSVWAQYTIRLPRHCSRPDIQTKLSAQGIPTAVYYPLPLHLQTAYRDYPGDPAGLPVCEAMATDVLSLPMHPYLDTDSQQRIIEALHAAVAE